MARFRLTTRKVENEKFTLAGHPQFATHRDEDNIISGVPQVVEQHMGARESRMATQLDFARRGKPAQMEAIRSRDEKGRFRKIVFGCNRLQHSVVKPVLKRTHRCRIALEQAIGKGIDLEHT